MTATQTKVTPRLKQRYAAEIAPALQKEFGFKNVNQVPRLTKIVVNMGVGEAAKDSKLIEGAVRDLTIITGQKPAVAKATKSIANFKHHATWFNVGYPPFRRTFTRTHACFCRFLC